MKSADEKWMNYAISLAKRGWGNTSPNPLVGAIIVRDNAATGRGWHWRAGENHAEINALEDAGNNAELATLYVTLEPCSTHGRTPPCTDAVIGAGIKRVVIGALDPNPRHAGRGVDILENAGIEVLHGVCRQQCDELNEAFYKWIKTGVPFVLLKMAMTLDGKIATRNGCSQWITGSPARRRVHRLRQWADAIIVGGETVRQDKPSLTARDRQGQVVKEPRRIIISRSINKADARQMMPDGRAPEIYRPEGRDGWQTLMSELGRQEGVSVLVEGGGELAAEMLEAGVIDRAEFHIAPRILGGRNGRSVVGGKDPLDLASARKLKNVRTGLLGEDIYVTGDL